MLWIEVENTASQIFLNILDEIKNSLDVQKKD